MLQKLLSPIGSIILIICIGFATSFLISGTSEQADNSASTQALFAATFPDGNSEPQALKQWQGKIIVLNFWATWCPPCREEMPELSELNTQYRDKNVIVIGIAIDDIGLVNEFRQETKVSYPLLAAENGGMELASGLGNNKGVLPYTVIINSDGAIKKTYFGRITKSLLEKTLHPLI
ncbi:MAG: TlpA family protein disulfide reductase [Methylophilaceae bacterium]